MMFIECSAGETGIESNVRGVTLTELLVVVSIMGILFAIGTLSYQGMRNRYNAEKQTKEVYTNLMDARLGAMQHGRDHFAVFASSTSATAVRIYEDGPFPNGDGVYSSATDSLIATYMLLPSFTMTLSKTSMTLIQFTSKGLVDAAKTGSVRLKPMYAGEYDCIFIDQVKTGMGKWNGTTNTCIVK